MLQQSQFLSDLGGTAGLYLGASFLTFLELIDLTFSCCASCCCCRGRGKRPKERRPKGSRYPEDDDRGRDRRYGDMYRSDLDFYNDPAARYDQGLRFRPWIQFWFCELIDDIFGIIPGWELGPISCCHEIMHWVRLSLKAGRFTCTLYIVYVDCF